MCLDNSIIKAFNHFIIQAFSLLRPLYRTPNGLGEVWFWFFPLNNSIDGICCKFFLRILQGGRLKRGGANSLV